MSDYEQDLIDTLTSRVKYLRDLIYSREGEGDTLSDFEEEDQLDLERSDSEHESDDDFIEQDDSIWNSNEDPDYNPSDDSEDSDDSEYDDDLEYDENVDSGDEV